MVVRLSAADIRVSCAHRNQVLVQGDRLMQPLPGLVQRVDAVSNTYTIATAVKGHSFLLTRRQDENGCYTVVCWNSHTHALYLLLSCFRHLVRLHRNAVPKHNTNCQTVGRGDPNTTQYTDVKWRDIWAHTETRCGDFGKWVSFLWTRIERVRVH